MRRHVLIVIHGMGVYVDQDGKPVPDWTDSVTDVLKLQYQKYPSLLTDFDELFEVVHVDYDTVFDQLLKRWADEAEAIENHGVESAEIATRMLGWLSGGQAHDENFAWTHVGDVVLYHYFNLLRQRVKVHVAKQIHTALQPRQGEGAVTRWSIIAHSLGTIVAHDVLHAMSASTPNEPGVPLLSSIAPKPRVVAMLANVSKTLEHEAKVYESQVIPGRACRSYLSANNKFDPFVQENLLVPKSFDPTGVAAWDEAKGQGMYMDIETENVNELNVHSAENYLVNPAVHIPLFRAMCGAGSIPNTLERNAMEHFQNISSVVTKESLDTLLNKYRDEAWYQAIGKLLPLMEAG